MSSVTQSLGFMCTLRPFQVNNQMSVVAKIESCTQSCPAPYAGTEPNFLTVNGLFLHHLDAVWNFLQLLYCTLYSHTQLNGITCPEVMNSSRMAHAVSTWGKDTCIKLPADNVRNKNTQTTSGHRNVTLLRKSRVEAQYLPGHVPLSRCSFHFSNCTNNTS